MSKKEVIMEALHVAFDCYNETGDDAKAERLSSIINEWGFQEMLEGHYGDR